MILRKVVYENLNNAKENGYFKPGEQLHGATPEEIANDLLAYAVDCEPIDDPQLLVPYIVEWLKLYPQ